MNYGFVIDNRKCIGCHACTTACKAENEVPLGVNRTWVKYVETGAFPNTRRHFQVTRCNHCANPPCVRICPVTAMYQRHDGIVEFDSDICIGCKACMQACPYDAIYIDPEFGTASKCHFCAHRIDVGLEPACVVVCPEHAIIAGDMDDPTSEISRVLAATNVTVRKPEQGTAPKLFYIDGNDWALHPTVATQPPATYMFADVIASHDVPLPRHSPDGGSPIHRNGGALHSSRSSISGTAIRAPQSQGDPWGGPILIGERMAEHLVQIAYNAQHKIPWHWPVPAYLVTKGIGAGVFSLLSLGFIFGWFPFDGLTFIAGGLLSLIFIAMTTLLLVIDLEKPERFLYIIFRPQWKSWLARGAFILIAFSIVTSLWWLAETAAYLGWLPDGLAAGLRPLAMWIGLPLAIGVAVYTAFLFGQAEGRDFWQSALLPVHLSIEAMIAGSALFLLMNVFLPLSAEISRIAVTAFTLALILNLLVAALGEFGMPHASEVAARAAHEISRGRYRNYFWWGGVLLGHAVPLLLLLVDSPAALAAAALCAIAGLYAYEYAFVMAPQEIPNS